MIKNDPLRRQYHALLILLVCMIPVFLFELAIQFISFQSGHRSIITLPFFIIDVIFFTVAISGAILGIIVTLYSLRTMESQRKRALQGDQTLLAKVQPISNEAALVLPSSIQLRFKTHVFVLFLAIPLLIAIAVFAIIGSADKGNTTTWIITSIVLGVFCLIMVVAFVVSFSIMKRYLRYQVDVNEYGITGQFYGRTTSMRWSEARFFAVSGVHKTKRPSIYELSNEHTSVRWLWLPRNMYFFYPFVPNVTHEEYERHMQALLELVEAKPHLPLYDLRAAKKWYL